MNIQNGFMCYGFQNAEEYCETYGFVYPEANLYVVFFSIANGYNRLIHGNFGEIGV